VHRIAFAVLVLAGIAAAQAKASSCPAGRAGGARGDTLVVGFTAGPPFVITTSNDRDVHGYAVDLLRTLALHEGWHLALVELSAPTLRTRLAACEIDVGVVGVAASASLAEVFELSQPYFSTVTTVIVKADDDAHAAPLAGHGRVGKLVHLILRGLTYGLAALGALALAAWLLNAFTGFPGGAPLRWRRIDATVSGPWAGLCWLARSITGRVLAAGWAAAGIALGVTGAVGAPPPPVLGDDPLRALVERAAHNEALIGERYPDGAQVSCSADEARACFHGFADGTMAAIAGPREVLCLHARELSLDDAIVRDDLAIPEQFAYVLPPGSPLRARLDRALLRHHEQARVEGALAQCPGEER
jgi:ABC-type amino acid transport substrate-binding protein